MRTHTTASRRRQNDAVDSRSSCTRLFLVLMTPMLYNLQGNGILASNELLAIATQVFCDSSEVTNIGKNFVHRLVLA